MMYLLDTLMGVFQIIGTWTIVGCLTAPIVWGIYCWEHRGDE